MKSKSYSFLDISALTELPESIKDEMRIATLHGIDITNYALKYKDNSERLHYIRLLLQSGVRGVKQVLNFNTDILRVLVRYVDTNTDFLKILSRYTHNGMKYTILDDSTLLKVLEANLETPLVGTKYNFLKIPFELVDSFLYAIRQNIDVLDIQELCNKKDEQVIRLLISLRVADIPIDSFVNGDWNKAQIYALISGSNIIKPEELIQRFDLTDSFTEGEIKEVIRAYSVSPNVAQLISFQDDEGFPVYNQYQMYEICEGVRLGLDVTSYYSPENTDLTMRVEREKLMKLKEKKDGKLFKEKMLTRANITIDDDLMKEVGNIHN